MTVALANTASSALLALKHDFSCCVYDGSGRQVAMKDALPIHTNSMHLFIERIVEAFGDDVYFIERIVEAFDDDVYALAQLHAALVSESSRAPH